MWEESRVVIFEARDGSEGRPTGFAREDGHVEELIFADPKDEVDRFRRRDCRKSGPLETASGYLVEPDALVPGQTDGSEDGHQATLRRPTLSR
jgi:hypothetical protein